MKFRTFSIVAGSLACNARCPFCVARMTPTFGLGTTEPAVNWASFDTACQRARESNVNTVMFTSNGETTMFPNQITAYLRTMATYQFAKIELQTNGILIAESKVTRDHLRAWHDGGLRLIAVSIAHYDAEKNRQIFLPHRQRYIDLPGLIRLLHEESFAVRLSCVMATGWIDSAQELVELLRFAKDNQVEQLTATPVNKPADSRDEAVLRWSSEHCLTTQQLANIVAFLDREGTLVCQLPHGARIYEVAGQNLCLSNCLTVEKPETQEFRNLIFFPDGRLVSDWQREDAVVA